MESIHSIWNIVGSVKTSYKLPQTLREVQRGLRVLIFEVEVFHLLTQPHQNSFWLVWFLWHMLSVGLVFQLGLVVINRHVNGEEVYECNMFKSNDFPISPSIPNNTEFVSKRSLRQHSIRVSQRSRTQSQIFWQGSLRFWSKLPRYCQNISSHNPYLLSYCYALCDM